MRLVLSIIASALLGAFLLVLCTEAARAQTACYHVTNAGIALDIEGSADTVCAEVITRLDATFPSDAPHTQTSCSVSGSSHFTGFLNNGSSIGYTWESSIVGACSAEPPASGASGVDPFTQQQSVNLLVWACFPLLFGIGYIGGRLR